MSSEEEDDLGLTAVTAVKGNASFDEFIPGQLQLFVISNGNFTTHTLLDVGQYSIGRSSGCDIAINDDSISRRHAVLRLGKTSTIEDLGSVNGTLVRGSKIAPNQPTPITIGELVGLGTASVILQRRSRSVRPRTLWTHEHFVARVEEECAREERSAAAFALLRLKFAPNAPEGFVEDTLGELLRDSDILGKQSSHEYEALLPDTPPAKADEAVTRIKGKLLDRGLKCKIYVACCPRDGRTAAQLEARAQKQTGQETVTAIASDVIVCDAQMQGLYRLVEQIAVSDISVLLLGETGVGKEVFARAVHRASPRATGPFVELNCAALTEPLLESELFGHEKGAFTNAVAAKPGLLETAHGGTLFLDEIGDMPLTTQVKLLRVIEDSQLRRVGGLKSRTIDVRFVAATNADIETQVQAGTFRSDLFFRLNGVTIVIPPLRERTSEIEPLVNAFIRRARRSSNGASRVTLSPEALQMLRAHSWPGNVRELKNVIERAVLLCGDDASIRPEHLSLESSRATRSAKTSSSTLPVDDTRETDTPTQGLPVVMTRPRKGSVEEQQWIMQALRETNGNQTLAARLLGISRRTLVNRLNDYGRPRKT